MGRHARAPRRRATERCWGGHGARPAPGDEQAARGESVCLTRIFGSNDDGPMVAAAGGAREPELSW
jgi:hypothetical protein